MSKNASGRYPGRTRHARNANLETLSMTADAAGAYRAPPDAEPRCAEARP
ncbi:hypothetical protein [Roseovarius sp. SYSU LYC5161]